MQMSVSNAENTGKLIFREELKALINKHSKENGSDTPRFHSGRVSRSLPNHV